MKVQEKCFCIMPFFLTAVNYMRFQQLQNTHATKDNQMCMHTRSTTCLVQESTYQISLLRPEARVEGVLITPLTLC